MTDFPELVKKMSDNLQHNLWKPPIQPVGNVLPHIAFSGSLVQRLPTSLGPNLHLLQCLDVQLGLVRTITITTDDCSKKLNKELSRGHLQSLSKQFTRLCFKCFNMFLGLQS